MDRSMDFDRFRSLSGFAKERADLASSFLTDGSGREAIRTLRTGAEEWRRNERLRRLVDGSTFSLAEASRTYSEGDAMRAMRAHLDSGALSAARAYLDGGALSATQAYLESDTMRAARAYLDSGMLSATRAYLDTDTMRAARRMMEGPRMALATAAAERAGALTLPAELARHEATTRSLAIRIGLFDPDRIMRDGVMLEAFARSAAMSDALTAATRVDRNVLEAARAYSSTRMPDLGSLAAHRSFLDASGLWLPRWPRYRLVTAAEKRRRFRQRLERNAAPPHLKRAKSLVHQYERVLREFIDAAMTATYGDDWGLERLPLCGCNTLLGKARARGGEPLDHADYAHYRMIMIHPEHHADVFSIAFEDPEDLARLIDDAGRLRARSHHAGDFSPDDLRDLRVVWRTIEVGLLSLEADFAVE